MRPFRAFLRALLGAGTVGAAVGAAQAPRVEVPHPQQVVSVGVSAEHVATATFMDRTVRLFDAKTGELVRELTDDAEVQVVAFSPDGEHLASGRYGGATVWRVADGQPLQRLTGVPEGYEVGALSFSGDGARLALAHTVPSQSRSVAVRLFDVAKGAELLALDAHPGRVETAVALSSDGKLLAVPEGNLVRLLDAEKGQEVRTLRRFGENVVGGGRVSQVVFSPDGKLLAGATIGFVYEAVVWDVESGRLVAQLEGHRELVWSLAFSPDGRALATGSDDKAVRLFGVPDGRLLRKLDLPRSGGVRSVAFSPDGRTLAVGDRAGLLGLHAVEPR